MKGWGKKVKQRANTNRKENKKTRAVHWKCTCTVQNALDGALLCVNALALIAKHFEALEHPKTSS